MGLTVNRRLQRWGGEHNDTQALLAGSSTGCFLTLEMFLIDQLDKLYGFSLFEGSTVYTYQEPGLGLL